MLAVAFGIWNVVWSSFWSTRVCSIRVKQIIVLQIQCRNTRLPVGMFEHLCDFAHSSGERTKSLQYKTWCITLALQLTVTCLWRTTAFQGAIMIALDLLVFMFKGFLCFVGQSSSTSKKHSASMSEVGPHRARYVPHTLIHLTR